MEDETWDKILKPLFREDDIIVSIRGTAEQRHSHPLVFQHPPGNHWQPTFMQLKARHLHVQKHIYENRDKTLACAHSMLMYMQLKKREIRDNT